MEYKTQYSKSKILLSMRLISSQANVLLISVTFCPFFQHQQRLQGAIMASAVSKHLLQQLGFLGSTS